MVLLSYHCLISRSGLVEWFHKLKRWETMAMKIGNGRCKFRLGNMKWGFVTSRFFFPFFENRHVQEFLLQNFSSFGRGFDLSNVYTTLISCSFSKRLISFNTRYDFLIFFSSKNTRKSTKQVTRRRIHKKYFLPHPWTNQSTRLIKCLYPLPTYILTFIEKLLGEISFSL